MEFVTVRAAELRDRDASVKFVGHLSGAPYPALLLPDPQRRGHPEVDGNPTNLGRTSEFEGDLTSFRTFAWDLASALRTRCESV